MLSGFSLDFVRHFSRREPWHKWHSKTVPIRPQPRLSRYTSGPVMQAVQCQCLVLLVFITVTALVIYWPVYIYFSRGSGGEVLWWAHLCVSVCLWVYLLSHMHDLYQIFLCMLPMAVAWSSSGSVTKSEHEGAVLVVLFPTDNAL